MARTAKADLEQRWFDCFVGWDRADREAALRVLTTLHRTLPDKPAKKASAVSGEVPSGVNAAHEAGL